MVASGVSIFRTATISIQKRTTPATYANALSTCKASTHSSKLTRRSYDGPSRCGGARPAPCRVRCSLGPTPEKERAPGGAPSFAEPISLSSTTLADHRLPPAAFETGFDLVALRARRVRESRRVRPPAQGAGERKVRKFGTPLQQRLVLGLAELEREGGQVLLEVRERERARDRQHRGGAPEEPCERDLRGGRTVLPGDLLERPASVAPEREEGHEHQPLAGAVVHHLVVLAFGEVVAVLHGDDRHDLPSPLDLLDPDLGDADMPDRPLVPKLLDRGQALLERGLGVDPVQVVELDHARAQAAKAFLDLLAEDLGPALARTEATFGRDDAAVGRSRERGADRLLALPSGVEMGGVDQADSGRDCLPDELDVLLRLGQPVRSEPDPGHFGIAHRQRSRVHLRDSARSWRYATTQSRVDERKGRPRPGPCASLPSRRYAESAFAFSESYSACEIAPLSSNCFAFSISPAGPLVAATPLT